MGLGKKEGKGERNEGRGKEGGGKEWRKSLFPQPQSDVFFPSFIC